MQALSYDLLTFISELGATDYKIVFWALPPNILTEDVIPPVRVIEKKLYIADTIKSKGMLEIKRLIFCELLGLDRNMVHNAFTMFFETTEGAPETKKRRLLTESDTANMSGWDDETVESSEALVNNSNSRVTVKDILSEVEIGFKSVLEEVNQKYLPK